MNKHMKKLIKYYQQADQCVTRKKAKKLIKKAAKAYEKIDEKEGDKS